MTKCKHSLIKALLATLEAIFIFSAAAFSQIVENFRITPLTSSCINFGESVSISGDRAIIGVPKDFNNGIRTGSAYIFRFDGKSWEQMDILRAVDGEDEDDFGCSVSISGDFVVVGAEGDKDRGEHSGSAYVFHYDGEDWRQVEKLTAADGAEWDLFGKRVCINSTRIIIGKARPINSIDSGFAYIYQFDGTAWKHVAKLIPYTGVPGDPAKPQRISVAISADYAVIGVANDGNLDSGAVYVYEDKGKSWIQTAKLTASDGAEGDFLGHSVSISGQWIIAGAKEADTKFSAESTRISISDAGATYVFQLKNNKWSQAAKLTGDIYAAAGFGESVSIDGDRAVIGAPGDDQKGTGAGAVYIFMYDGETWKRTIKMTASDAKNMNRLGEGVFISGERAIVGGANTNCAYLIHCDGNSWGQEIK